jgi:hypothetical protein
MSDQRKTCQHLLLLVGSNPLPNFLAVLILKPESICLFYSPETEQVKDNLRKIFMEANQDVYLKEICIEDATNTAKVRGAFASISNDAHLHYTGGTKIMAAHARLAFRDVGGKDENASYLDERKAVLRFDNGYELDISKQVLKLTIDRIFGLHGIERIPKREQPILLYPTDKDAIGIADSVFEDPFLVHKLYTFNREGGKRCTYNKVKSAPKLLDHLVKGLSIQQLPENDWNNPTYEKWCDFLEGGWLESWCSGFVQDIATGSEVLVGVDCKRSKGRQFEIDIVLVRGHRIYVISCTTDTKIGLCKSKLFEIAMRARQLGGDLARSALVCLLHGSDSNGFFIDQLRNDIADIWDAPNTPEVFGLDDLKEWSGKNYGEPKVGSLQKWLDS